jgi:hypothetical protein
MIEASASVWIGLNIRRTGAAEVAKGGRSARRGAKRAHYYAEAHSLPRRF